MSAQKDPDTMDTRPLPERIEHVRSLVLLAAIASDRPVRDALAVAMAELDRLAVDVADLDRSHDELVAAVGT